VLAFDSDFNLVEAPDVLLFLFVVLNRARYRCELRFSVELHIQQLLHIVILDFKTPNNLSHCTSANAKLDCNGRMCKLVDFHSFVHCPDLLD
jgi:hypothetical protein